LVSPEKKEISEQMLVIQLKDGSQQAFKHLFDRYTPKIYRFAISYLKSEADAEELVQNVFLKLWERRESLDESRNVKSYIFKIAINCIYDLAREKKYWRTYKEFVSHNLVRDNEFTWNEVVYNELSENVNLLLDQMPPQRKKIFLMSRKQGISNKEIAASLNISQRTVENQIYRAVSYLKEKIKTRSLFFLLFFYLNC